MSFYWEFNDDIWEYEIKPYLKQIELISVNPYHIKEPEYIFYLRDKEITKENIQKCCAKIEHDKGSFLIELFGENLPEPKQYSNHSLYVNDEEKLKEQRNIESLILEIRELDPDGLLCKIPENKTKSNIQFLLNDLRDYKDKFSLLLENHKKYRKNLFIGYFLWPLSIFIIPFIIGMITEGGITGGAAVVLLTSFIYPVLLPLSFIIGFVIHPHVLKSIIFEEPDISKFRGTINVPANFYKIYIPEIANYINVGDENLKQNSAAVLAGTFLSRYI